MNQEAEVIPGRSSHRARIVHELAHVILESPRREDYVFASEKELCSRFGVSRVTVRYALADLESQGLVYRRHGKGTFVRGQRTRVHADLAILGSAAVWRLRPLADLIAGMQAVISPFHAALIMVSDPPSEWSAEAARTWGGLLIIGEGLSEREEGALRAFSFPCLRLAESTLAREEIDLFELGRRAAVMLNYAAATKTAIDQRQWEQSAPKVERNPTMPMGHPPRLSRLPSDKIEAILGLVRSREAIVTQLHVVKMRLAEIDAAVKLSPQAGPKRKVAPQLRKPARVLAPIKDKILAVLKSAGPDGVKPKEVAKRIHRKTGSVTVWLYTEGMRISGVYRPNPGRFAYRKLDDAALRMPPQPGHTQVVPVEDAKEQHPEIIPSTPAATSSSTDPGKNHPAL